MKYLLLVAAIYSASVAETTLIPALDLGAAAPDLLLVVGLAWLFGQRGGRGFAGASLAGLASDLNSAGRLGPALATMAIAAWAFERLRRKLPLDNPITQAAFSLPAVGLVAGLAAASQYLLAGEPVPWTGLAAHISRGSLATAALALPVYTLCCRRRGAKRPGRWQFTLAR